ncbi:hypothetical protein ACROYT_G029733 [Oculina patagonica]
MGGNSSSKNSYSQPRQKPPTSSGFLGRGRMTQQYHRDVKIYVREITAQVLGRELIRRCGNEGQHPYLDATGRTTLRFLRTAISFIPDAQNDGGDMCNAAFILSQPGQEFLIQAGDGDWEFFFAEEADGQIYGRNVRKPFFRYAYDRVKSVVSRIGSFIGGLFSIAGPASRLALM